jgi:activating signal cointegrator 1
MYALSLCQPWATLLVTGSKRFETRSWKTAHRGVLAIHASKKLTPAAKLLCDQAPFKDALALIGIHSFEQLPLGKIIGTVELLECHLATSLDVPDTERHFGDFRPGQVREEIAVYRNNRDTRNLQYRWDKPTTGQTKPRGVFGGRQRRGRK